MKTKLQMKREEAGLPVAEFAKKLNGDFGSDTERWTKWIDKYESGNGKWCLQKKFAKRFAEVLNCTVKELVD